jgi:hypothetical protein
MSAARVLVAALALGFAAAAPAQKSCTRADEANAGKVIDRASSWPALVRAWKDFRHCDKGPVGELYTEALLRTIIDWKGVDAFADAMKDIEFREFVLAHLLSDAAKEDRPDVYSRAKRNCPKGQEAFCADLAEAVKPAAPTPPPTPIAPLAPISPAPTGTPAAPAAPEKK